MATKVQGLWASGDAYENYMGRWSRLIAPRFLEWLAAAPKEAWLDIGCGTGVLSATILAQADPARVAGIDASEPFLDAARERVRDPRFEVGSGNALALPFDDREFGVAVSGLVLNFMGDSGKAVAEMVRVVRPGGRVALYVWDYAGHMQIMRHFFDAATAMDARAREFDDGVRAPICRPGPLGELFDVAGLRDVDVRAIDVPAPFASFDDYWTPFLGGTGSAPKHYASLPSEQQIALRDNVRRRLPVGPDGEILLAVRAWAVKGTVT